MEVLKLTVNFLMINMGYIIGFLLLLLSVAGFAIRNLLKKVERYEEDVLLKDEFISKFRSLVEEAHRKVKELDSLGAFESDDEVGHFFKNLKTLSIALDAYFKNYVSEEDAETK